RVVLMVDTSASMGREDVGGQSRLDYVRAQWLNEARLGALDRDYEVELVGFDDGARAMPAEALHGGVGEAGAGRGAAGGASQGGGGGGGGGRGGDGAAVAGGGECAGGGGGVAAGGAGGVGGDVQRWAGQ